MKINLHRVFVAIGTALTSAAAVRQGLSLEVVLSIVGAALLALANPQAVKNGDLPPASDK